MFNKPINAEMIEDATMMTFLSGNFPFMSKNKKLMIVAAAKDIFKNENTDLRMELKKIKRRKRTIN